MSQVVARLVSNNMQVSGVKW